MHEKRGQMLNAPLRKLLLLCLIYAIGLGAEASSWTVERLMHSLASVEQRQVRFSEIRELTLLQQALTSEGSLSFQRPDNLIKQFDPPNGLRYEIDANRLLINKSDGREEIIRLDNAPQLQAYVAALQAVLAGNLQRLQTYFELHLDGDPDSWQLTLLPKQPGLARQIVQIEITGAHSDIDRFVVSEQGGDRIITRLHARHAE
jgi:hypothetical protein